MIGVVVMVVTAVVRVAGVITKIFFLMLGGGI